MMRPRNLNAGYVLSRAALAALLLAVCAAHMGESAEPQTPPRLKRADSFLSVHFDFHAGADCREVGKNTTPAHYRKINGLFSRDNARLECLRRPLI